MDWSIPVTGFVAFIGGLSLVSKLLAWAATVHLALRSSKPPSQSVVLAIVPLVLHSGPWLLAAAVGALYYIANHASPAVLWSAVVGLAASCVFVASFAIYANLRGKQPSSPATPLTPERLLLIRQRFFWLSSLGFGGFSAALLLYYLWPTLSQSWFLVVYVVAVSLCVGWLYSWFMWQWYGASLEAREETRLRRDRQNAV